MIRIFDILLSVIAIIILLPLWMLVPLLIWIEGGRPIFYLQQRVGKGGKLFNVIKFRSMKNVTEINGIPVQAKENDPRVTRIGRLLRSTALDEAPQLINILKGEMSFVGPRALALNEIHPLGEVSLQNIEGYKERILAKPGLTGIAQVYAPRDIPPEEKFKYDIYYIKNCNLWVYLKLIFLSLLLTFRAGWEKYSSKCTTS